MAELCLGVDQVASGDRQLLPRLHPGQYLHVIAGPVPDFHIPLQEHARLGLYPHNLPLARIHYSSHRNDQRVGHGNLDCGGYIHLRLQLQPRIGDLHPEPERPRLRVEERINQLHLTVIGLPRIRRGNHGDLTADLDRGEIALEDLQLHPDAGKIGYAEERVSHVHKLTLLHELFGNHTGKRAVERYPDRRGYRFLQQLELLFLESEHAQALAGFPQSHLGVSRERGRDRTVQNLDCLVCEKVLLLGIVQVEREDFGNRHAFLHLRPHAFDQQPVDMPPQPCGNLTLPFLVIGHDTGTGYILREGLHGNSYRSQVGHYLLGWRQRDMTYVLQFLVG